VSTRSVGTEAKGLFFCAASWYHGRSRTNSGSSPCWRWHLSACRARALDKVRQRLGLSLQRLDVLKTLVVADSLPAVVTLLGVKNAAQHPLTNCIRGCAASQCSCLIQRLYASKPCRSMDQILLQLTLYRLVRRQQNYGYCHERDRMV